MNDGGSEHTEDRDPSIDRLAIMGRYAHDIIVLADDQYKIVEANETTIATYGYTYEEITKLRFFDLRMPEEKDALTEQMAWVEKQGSSVYETKHCCKDGTRIPVEVSTTLVEVGGKKHYLCVARDISSRKKAELLALDRELRLKRAQRTARLGSWEIVYKKWPAKQEDRVFSWSDETFNILGLDPRKTLPTYENYCKNIDPADLDRVRDSFHKALLVVDPIEVEFRVLCEDGKRKWVRQRVEVDYEGPSKPRQITGTIQDITEYRNLEEQVQQSQKLETIGRLAGGVAHDFNNLLTVINGYSELLLQQIEKDHPLFEYADQIRKAGFRAEKLTNQLLVISRRHVIEPKLLDLNTTIRESMEVLGRVLGENIEIASVLAAEKTPILADPAQIQQVLMNLALNARDAMPGQGCLKIETQNVLLDEGFAASHLGIKPGHYVLLEVSDTGVGIPADIRSHIFEPFFTTKEKASGLGLAVVLGIVKQMGGWISVSSEESKGSLFKLYLPRGEAPGRPLPDGEKKQLPQAIEGGNETVLLVEDEAEVRKFVAEVLRGYGYSTMEASNGQDALARCENMSGVVHLLLTDVIMPGMTGRELARHLQALYPDMKVLYMSGYAENVITHEGRLEPGIEHLAKPFSPEALAHRVRQVLECSV